MRVSIHIDDQVLSVSDVPRNRALVPQPGRQLVPLQETGGAFDEDIRCRPLAGFVAQLAATFLSVAQTRTRRREEPAEAAVTYRGAGTGIPGSSGKKLDYVA